MNVKVVVLFAVLAAFFLLAVAVSRAVIVHGGKPETTSTGRAPQAFHSSLGCGLVEPSGMSSATETGVSSVQRGKFTNIRPFGAIVTPVTC
jgi:hypothetical protein